MGTYPPYAFLTVTRTHPTAIPKAGKSAVQDAVKINPREEKKKKKKDINDLAIKPLPGEVTKF